MMRWPWATRARHREAAPFEHSRRTRTPIILQMDALECGAAALAMVLAYHGRWMPLEQLRVLCGVSRDGSKAVNLLKAARGLGLSARGVRLDPADLGRIPLPAILFVDMNHFVVLEGGAPGVFFLNDPAHGRRRVTAAEFDRMFSGVALVFEKTDAFRMDDGVRPRVSGLLFKWLSGSRAALAAITLSGVLAAALMLLTPAFNRVFVDEIIMERAADWLGPLLIAMVIAAGGLAVACWLRGLLVTRLHAKLSAVISGRLVWHILRLPPGFFSQRHSGMIGARLSLVEDIVAWAADRISHAIFSLTVLLFFTVLMLQYHVVLTLACLALGLLGAAVQAYVQQRLGDTFHGIALYGVKMSGKLAQGLHMVETLKATGADKTFFTKWAGLQVLAANAQQRLGQAGAMLAAVPALTSMLMASTALVLGGFFIMRHEMTVGMLVAFSFMLISLSEALNALMAMAGALHQTRGAMAQIDDTLRHPLAREFTAQPVFDGREPSRLSGDVSLRDVTVAYSPVDDAIIRGLSLEATSGSRVALVGASGSGKSTLGHLIAGLLEPLSGEVLLDRRPVMHWPRGLVRRSLAVVDQDVILFEGSVRDNLTLWDDSLSLARIQQAAKDALIHEAIMARPGRYDSLVEESGRNFSGGQRQRLEIARALAGNPSVLVLDEATSALDAVTEQAIMANLRRRGCTCIIIAHRLSTIRDCDEIIVLDHGQIIERGTHEQLMAMKGAYRELIET